MEEEEKDLTFEEDTFGDFKWENVTNNRFRFLEENILKRDEFNVWNNFKLFFSKFF